MSKIITKPELTFTEALNEAKGRLVQFTGRSRRSEYWWCALAVFVVNLVLGWIPLIGGVISILTGLTMIPLSFRRLHDSGHSGWWYGVSMILGIVIFFLLMSLLVAAGLSTDSNISFESLQTILLSSSAIILIVLYLIGLILGIVILVFLLQDSKPYPNKYGASPKYVMEDETAMSDFVEN